MLRIRGKVQFRDGETAEFETGSAALAAYERYALRHGYPIGADMPPTLGALVVAHYALDVEEGFDAWADRVDGVEMETENENPTEPEPSTG